MVEQLVTIQEWVQTRYRDGVDKNYVNIDGQIWLVTG